LLLGLAPASAFAAGEGVDEGSAAAVTPASGTEGGGPFQTFDMGLIFPDREVHVWKRYVRDFRMDHNFALVVGAGVGNWAVPRFGTIREKSFPAKTVNFRAQYSFHLPIYRGFGYFLGSTSAYDYPVTTEPTSFYPAPVIQYPTLLVGLVYNFTPGFRGLVSFDYGIARIEDMAERDGRSGRVDGLADDPTISATLETFDGGIAADFFVRLNWAVRAEIHRRFIRHAKPKKLANQPIDADFYRDDRWVGLGLAYHLM
jgi:hypothetical protein